MRLSLRQLPNVISSLRIFLVVPIALTLWHHQFFMTLGLFVIAAVSDAADGCIARHFGWQSELGAILDPLADKLMLSAVFVVLALLALVPTWLMATALVRDIIIVVGAVAYRICFGGFRMSPSAISKLNTSCQMIFLLAVIARAQFEFPAPHWIVCLGALTFVTTLISGIDYVLVWGRRALAQSPQVRA